jgi:DNA mismatch repair protein MSH3
LVAQKNNYSRPTFVDKETLEIIDGRHPMAEVIRNDPFMPNTIKLGASSPKSKIITGPNMGGKSSLVRMIGIAC